MAIDPSELHALDLALEHFDEAYTNVVQAARRVLMLASENAQGVASIHRAPVQSDGHGAPTVFPPAPPHKPIEMKNAPAITGPDARAVARASGYTGDACTRCHSFAVVRTGTCSTCQNCGHNGGCA